MEVEIEVVKKAIQEQEIDEVKLLTGTVVEMANGIKAIVYRDNKTLGARPNLLMIDLKAGSYNFHTARGMRRKIVKVLGRIKKIIVEEI